MATQRLSRLQRRLLAWLAAEDQRTRGTMASSHVDLVRALAHDKGNLSASLRNLEVKGLVTSTRTPGGKAEAGDLTAAGRHRVAGLTASGEYGTTMAKSVPLGTGDVLVKTRALFILGSLVLLGQVGVAAGSVVVLSPPVHFDPNTQQVLCMALNVSSQPLDVTLQVLDSVGRPQGGARTERALPPQQMANSGVGLVILHDRFATCEVISQAGKRGDLWVTLCSTDIHHNHACVVAVTAQ
jgi:DNA-binding MarR family transcriptional regulator